MILEVKFNQFLGLFVAFLIGMFIYFVYQKCFRGVVYSHNYNIMFVLMTLITPLIIMTISTNIVFSLGMVGALSIVRFRTSVKDPMDIMYMFWAVSVGITSTRNDLAVFTLFPLFLFFVVQS